jgi:hypothetical protein
MAGLIRGIYTTCGCMTNGTIFLLTRYELASVPPVMPASVSSGLG